MSLPLQVGVIGCGTLACEHLLPALRRIRGVDVVALADPDPAARSRAARLCPAASLHDDAEAALALPTLDAVVIATPPATHAALAVSAARSGRHLYVEKPLATDVADARQVLDEVARAGVHATMGFNRRRHPLYARARALLAGGGIGRARLARTVFCEPADPAGQPSWRRGRLTGGGVLLDLASHHFDLLRWLLDDELDIVAAGTSSDASEQDGAWVQLATAAGVDGQSLFSTRAAHADIVELLGDRGRLRVDRHRGSLELTVRRRTRYGVRPAWSRPSADVYAWRARRLVRRGGDPSYARTLDAFVRRARGEQVETPTLEDGLRSLEAALAAERLAEASASGAR